MNRSVGKPCAPLRRGGATGRDDGFDLAIFERGENPAHTVDCVRRDPVRGSRKRFFDDARALGEPARVMFLARDGLVVPKARLRRDVHHDARKVVHGRVLLAGRAQRRPGRRRRRHCCSELPIAAPSVRARWATAQQWQLASGSVRQSFLNVPLVRASRSASLTSSTASRWRVTSASMLTFARIRPDQTGVDVDGLGRNQSRRLALPYDTREDPAKDRGSARSHLDGPTGALAGLTPGPVLTPNVAGCASGSNDPAVPRARRNR